MYIPHDFVEQDPVYIRDFIRTHSFGTIVTWDGNRPIATRLLFNIVERPLPELLLFGHIARSNAQWKTFSPPKEVLAIFEGPHTYVSAGWYSIKSAPTWNYIAVHAYGIPEIVDDKTELYELLRDLVNSQEQHVPEDKRYRIESLPKELLESMMNAIVGFKMKVSTLECAAKLSQNRSSKDYDNIISKLKERRDSDSNEIALEMERRKNRLY